MAGVHSGSRMGSMMPRPTRQPDHQRTGFCRPPRSPGKPAPVFTFGPQATSFKTRMRKYGFESGRRPLPKIVRRGGKAAAVAGYAGPGFYIWPTGHIHQDMDTKALIRIRPPAFAQKSFGETFGAATGVSDPGYKKTSPALSFRSLPLHFQTWLLGWWFFSGGCVCFFRRRSGRIRRRRCPSRIRLRSNNNNKRIRGDSAYDS